MFLKMNYSQLELWILKGICMFSTRVAVLVQVMRWKSTERWYGLHSLKSIEAFNNRLYEALNILWECVSKPNC